MTTDYSFEPVSAVSELAIVDTFTKLIFGQESRYSTAELRIIQALRITDNNVAQDSHPEMGTYLRALGVEEMIKLVSRVQRQTVSGHSHRLQRRDSDTRFPLPLGI